MGIKNLSRPLALDLCNITAVRRRRALIVGLFALTGVLSTPVVTVASGVGPRPEVPPQLQLIVTAGDLLIALVCLWRRERLGERAFLAVQVVSIAVMVPALYFTTPTGSLRSAELMLLGPLVIGVIFLESRWAAAVVTLLCAVGANVITLHRLAEAPDAGGEVFGELVCFALIAIVVRTLRESAFEALQTARTGEITDPLTGLPNRRGFERAGAASWQRSSAERAPVAVLVLDVDHFKQVNDTFGHAAGDQLLARLADVLRANLRPGDVAVRLGGEEFAVLSPIEPGQAFRVAERLRRALETELKPVTVSIGVVETVPGPVTAPADAAEALWRSAERADGGLYEAKRSGRNRVVVGPD
ncbi:MAG TPA: GGDEF domain-containing protein [Kineosporiaceae bacterium]